MLRAAAFLILLSLYIGTSASAKETWGYIDRQGQWLIPPQYHTEADVMNATASLRKELRKKAVEQLPAESSVGSTTNSGGTSKEHQHVAKRKLESSDAKSELVKRIGKFSDGLAPADCAPADSRDAIYGYVDETGTLVIPPAYEYAGPFKEDVAPVMIGERWYYIDRAGNKSIILPDTASHALPFKNGLAFVAVGGIAFAGQHFFPRHEARWGVVDHSGIFVVEPKFSSSGDILDELRFFEGLTPVSVPIGASYRFGFIDERGQMVIAPKYLHASYFHNGGAAVSVGDSSFDSDDFKSQRNRLSLVKSFFNELKTIGMERTKVHDLLGLPDDDFDSVNSSTYAVDQNQADSQKPSTRDTYSLNTASCGNELVWLDIDYRQDRVRRYRFKSINQVGGWVYDNRSPALQLEYVDTPREEIDPKRGVIGLQEHFQEKKVIAYYVTPGLPAAAAGIISGDEILSIDGKTVAGESYDSFPKLLAGLPGTSLTIKIKRGKAIEDKTIRRMWVGDITDFHTRCQFLRGCD